MVSTLKGHLMLSLELEREYLCLIFSFAGKFARVVKKPEKKNSHIVLTEWA